MIYSLLSVRIHMNMTVQIWKYTRNVNAICFSWNVPIFPHIELMRYPSKVVLVEKAVFSLYKEEEKFTDLRQFQNEDSFHLNTFKMSRCVNISSLHVTHALPTYLHTCIRTFSISFSHFLSFSSAACHSLHFPFPHCQRRMRGVGS